MRVLSNSGTVILANEAMARLLSVEANGGGSSVQYDGDEQGAAVDELRGLSLGIGLVHNGMDPTPISMN